MDFASNFQWKNGHLNFLMVTEYEAVGIWVGEYGNDWFRVTVHQSLN